MSITFWIPTAPRTKVLVPCDYGQGEAHACVAGNRCGYCHDGVSEEWRSPAPDLNVANTTARCMLLALGLIRVGEAEIYGSLKPKDMPGVRRKIVRILSTDAASQFTQAPYQVKRLISAGVDEERLQDRLRRLDAVISWAQKENKEMSWG